MYIYLCNKHPIFKGCLLTYNALHWRRTRDHHAITTSTTRDDKECKKSRTKLQCRHSSSVMKNLLLRRRLDVRDC